MTAKRPGNSRKLGLALSALLLVCLGWTPLSAQDVGARASLSSDAVGVGRLFVLNVEVMGSQSVDAEPELPDLSAFSTYLGSGTSTSMQIVNGRTTVSLTIQFRYQATAEGSFEIPSITVSVGGQSYETQPLTLSVSSTPPAEPGQPQGATDPTGVSPDDLFLLAQASRSRVREGEPFIVEYRIYTVVDVSSYGFTHFPEPEGFWVEELPLPESPQVEQVERDGRVYTTAVIRRVALVPTGPGERTLDPLGIEAQVRVRRRSLDPFESIFDRSSLFGSVTATAVLSNSLQIEVEPLPPGRPDPFSGVVGSLNLTATLDQDSVDANQAVTLTLTAGGQGNLRAVPEPVLDLPSDFEAYPPEVSESVRHSGSGLGGTKSWKYVLIPRAPGSRAIPSISLEYFDTETASYRSATTPPLPLMVAGEVTEGPAGLVRGGVASLREDIRFIHLGSPDLVAASRTVFGGTGFWSLLLLPMAAALGALALRLHWDRLEGDPAFARRRRASRIANKRLAKARRMARGDAPKEFYAEVASALRGFMADKINVAEAGMQIREASEQLEARGASEDVIQEVGACLDHCDRQRFAPPESDAEEEARFLDRVAGVMTDLNREVGR